MRRVSSAFQAEMVEYIGVMTPPAGAAEILRTVVPNCGSVTAWPTAGFASAVIGCATLSVTSPEHKSCARAVPLARTASAKKKKTGTSRDRVRRETPGVIWSLFSYRVRLRVLASAPRADAEVTPISAWQGAPPPVLAVLSW